jgi:putative ABC transport system permease protein
VAGFAVWRGLLRLDPGFAAVAVISLAPGIAANTAIFQLLSPRTLSVKSPQELAVVAGLQEE